MKELQRVFQEMEQEWRKPRSGAEEATGQSINRLNQGETLIFMYPWANPEKVDEIMESTGATGQFDLGLYNQSMLHVKI